MLLLAAGAVISKSEMEMEINMWHLEQGLKTEKLRILPGGGDEVIQLKHGKYCSIINVQYVVEIVFSNSFLP